MSLTPMPKPDSASGSRLMSRKSMAPALAARTSRWCCQSMPALQTGHLVLYQTVSFSVITGYVTFLRQAPGSVVAQRCRSRLTRLVLHGVRQPIGFHLGPDLRHIVPEHDDVVLLTLDIPHMVAQQRLGLEAQAFEQRDRRLLIDRHLHRKLFEAGT